MQNFNGFNNGYGSIQGCGGYNFMTSPRNEYFFVDGIEAAKAYQTKANSITLLMDSQMPICYRKQTDMYGRTIAFEIYDLVPHVEKPKDEYVTKAEFKAFIDSLKPKDKEGE